jgi:hypothetical protein
LLVSEVTENRSAEAKKFQASRPQNAYSGYGMPTSSGATRVKITEKTAVFTSGISTAQPNPITVCL